MVAFALLMVVPARIVPSAMRAVSFRYDHTTAQQTGDNRCNDQLEFHDLGLLVHFCYAQLTSPPLNGC